MKMTSSTLPITGSLSKASAPDAMSYEAAMGVIETLKALNESLKDDYDKLAAECGIHSKITLRIISMLSCSGYDPKENSLNPAEALLFDAEAALDTPEFNFALAEFKAQGVDAFKAWQKDLAHQSQGDRRHAYVAAVLDAEVFAANLRAGVAK